MIKGIGVDILSLERFSKINSKAFLIRTFHPLEINEYHKRNNLNYLASRFACKEAIVKALTEYNNDFNQIAILNDELGKPYVMIDNVKYNNIFISISYEDKYVIAYCTITI